MIWPASVDLKLKRAHEHVTALGAETARYFIGHPYGFPLDEHYEDARFILKVVTPPPDWISVLIGDVLHNARGALDHLVYNLAFANSSTPHPKSGFPIYNCERGYEGGGVRIISGVHPDAAEIIRSLQPYQMGKLPVMEDPHRHPLSVLYHLSNADKHRHLSPTVGSAKRVQVWLSEPDAGPIAMFGEMAAGMIYDGNEVARFPTTRDEVLRRQLEPEIQLTPFVALDEGDIWRSEPVEQVLLRTLEFIGGHVLPRFRPFFV
jgi:hypothetical protein